MTAGQQLTIIVTQLWFGKCIAALIDNVVIFIPSAKASLTIELDIHTTEKKWSACEEKFMSLA